MRSLSPYRIRSWEEEEEGKCLFKGISKKRTHKINGHHSYWNPSKEWWPGTEAKVAEERRAKQWEHASHRGSIRNNYWVNVVACKSWKISHTEKDRYSPVPTQYICNTKWRGTSRWTGKSRRSLVGIVQRRSQERSNERTPSLTTRTWIRRLEWRR